MGKHIEHSAVTRTNLSTDRKEFILICVVSALPLYWATLFFVEKVTKREWESVASAVVVCFYILFYAGWSMAARWRLQGKHPSPSISMTHVKIIAICVAWLFIHADFQWRGKPALNLFFFWLPFIILSFTSGLLVRMFRMSEKTQLQEAQVAAARSEGELQLLQSQLSPHFLFNTLNNLYGLSLTQHEKIPSLLLKLSDLLRYPVYEAREMFVPLEKEIAYINNYIEFEKLRIGSRLVLHASIDTAGMENKSIAPMLLIVFIENAFKHSKNTADKEIFVEIDLKTWQDRILFSVKNSFNRSEAGEKELKTDSGVGLSNAQKRLALLYPNEHELSIDEKDNFYYIQLQIKAK